MATVIGSQRKKVIVLDTATIGNLTITGAISGYATTSYVTTQISNLVDSSPATLDTLNELAAALGDDPNFATTTANSIGTKWTQNNTKISQWDTAYGWGNHASAGYTSNVGDITGVTAGTGLTGGGTSGTPTLNVIGGSGITANANDIAVDSTVIRTTGDQTKTGNFTISKTQPTLTLSDTNATTSSYPTINFDTANNQGVSIIHNEFDSELPVGGYGLVVGGSSSNSQFPTTGTLSFVVLGEIYAGSTTATSTSKVFHDTYHPNADKWTTARTLTLSGDVTGSVSFDGSAAINMTNTVVANNSHTHNNLSNYYLDSNPDGYTSNVGDITGVIGGTGLTGGGYSGTVTLNVIGGDGITANADNIAVDSTVVRTTGNQTLGGGLTIDGSVDSGATDMGFYQSPGTNLILKGDSVGRSGIFFESEKDGTNINDPSDYGFIQFHAYGYGATTGESADFVIGVSNDSSDNVILQSPYNGGVKVGYKDATSGTGLTAKAIWHEGSLTTTNKTNYDTAYGWGNHASAGYTNDQTAAEILTLLKTVDTDTSGLNSDTLDGVQLDNIVYGNYKGTFAGVTMDANAVSRTGTYTSSAFTNRPAGTSWTYLDTKRLYSNGNDYHKQISYDTYNNNMWTRTNSGGTWSSWYKMWNAFNDGSGSGLDADLLDGQQGSYYAPASSIPTVNNGTLYITTSGSVSGGGSFTANNSGNVTLNLTGNGIMQGTNAPQNSSFSDAIGAGFRFQRVTGGTNRAYGSHHNLLQIPNSSGDQYLAQMAFGTGDTKLAWRSKATAFGSWFDIWHSGNDGSGSGLDADLLDGQQGSYYYSSANPPPGDITGVTAGTGMTGGGTSGSVTLNVIGGSGITANADNITVDSSVIRTTGNQSMSGLKTFTDNGGIKYSGISSTPLWLNRSSGTNVNIRLSSSSGTTYVGQGASSGILEIGTTADLIGSGQRVFADNYHPNADTLTTARTISLGGDVTGSASFNGSSNITITAAVANDSHNHNHSDGNFTVNGVLQAGAGSNHISTAAAPFRWQRSSASQTGQDDNVSVHVDDSNIYFTHNNDADGDASGYNFRYMTGGTATNLLNFSSSTMTYKGNTVFHDAYHPNADKWTTARSHTVTLTGEVTGTATQSVDGTGNKTWSIATTLGNTALNDQYIKRGTPSLTSNITTIASSSDIVRWNNATTGRPASGQSNEYGPMLQMAYNGTIVSQLAHDFDQDNLYFRQLNTSTDTGTTWEQIFHDTYHPNADKWTSARTLTLSGDVTGNVNWDGSGNATMTTVVADNSHSHTNYALFDHFSHTGHGNYTSTTTAALLTEALGDNAFDSKLTAHKTGWSYSGNGNLTDAGRLTELAGTSWLWWTDNSADNVQGHITGLCIAPNTGGSAGKMFVYNNQSASYSPGWREIWTSTSDGSGSGLDADVLDGQEGSYYLDYNNFANTPTIPQGDITGVTAGTGMTGGGTSGAVTLNVIGGDGITANANDIAVDATVMRITGASMSGSLRMANDLNYFGTNATNNEAEIVVNTGQAGSPQIGFTEHGDASWAIGIDDADNSFKIHGVANANIPTINNLAIPLFEITTVAGTAYLNNSKVWHAGNDGSGSGLDADLLDGAQASDTTGNSTIVKRNSAGDILARKLYSTDGTNTISTFVSSTYNQISSIGSQSGGSRDLRFNLGQSGTIMTIISNKVQMHKPLLLDGSANTTQATSNIISTQSSDSSGATRYHLSFTKANGTTTLGRITTNNFSTTYTTSSDYRLKEDLLEVTDATAKLLSIQTRNFRWIGTDSRTDGFLAHELALIVPDAVVGEKDAMTTPTLYSEEEELPEGVSVGDVKVASVPDYQSIDQSKLVPLLIKTVQELEARIRALENS